ncbi:MAG: response regulator [Candidatus Tectomicrobia bacterium]|uniref:Response regulator n=1 Tax=Tectimicrobiota bacterium TaxID=2528274 RepID=A0A932HZV7_UNCTE|nr:response regulator [Candidatus Tectomicrobia bacterium]
MWRFIRNEIDSWITRRIPAPSLTILVVEDERPLCDLFVKVLSPLGHVVHAAVRGEEAISLLQTQTFDLVFLDLLLPGISGIEVYREIDRLPLPPEVIVITSFASSNLLVQALDIGLLTVIQKPFQMETIIEAVDRAALRKAGALRSSQK